MTDFSNVTIGDLLKNTALRYPESEALIYHQDAVRHTYSELYARCRSVAKGFMALGIKRGDQVSVWTTNLPEWVYLQFGLSMIGAVFVTINTSYKSSELEYILRQSNSTALVIMEQYRDSNLYEIVRGIVPELESSSPGMLSSGKLPMLKNIVYIGGRAETPGMLSFADVVALGLDISDRELYLRMNSLDVHDTINMQYTSGTTGFSKGVMLIHYNIVNNARMVGDVMGLTPQRPSADPGTAVSLLRLLYEHPQQRLSRFNHGNDRIFQAPRGTAADQPGTLHCNKRRPHHVHRHARSRGFRPLRHVVA